VKSGDTFDAREVNVRAWTDSLAVIENLLPGTEVALTNPTAPAGPSRTPSAAPSQRASR
jgi:hypothetical protein